MNAPNHLQHKPILVVNDYDLFDNNSDAKALSIGLAQWENDTDEISAKIFRNNGSRWSAQSEEMPLNRVLDLAILILASLSRDNNSNVSVSDLNETINESQRGNLKHILEYYQRNSENINSRIEELERLIELFRSSENTNL